jgi:hypothetical protein
MNPFDMIMFMFFAKIMVNDLPHAIMRGQLVDQYGSWAVGRAESVCPLNDVDCIEKEAARLQQTQLVQLRQGGI